MFAIRSPDTGEIVYVGASADPKKRLVRLRWEKVRHKRISIWLCSLASPPELEILDETETLRQGKAVAIEWRQKLGIAETGFCRRIGWQPGRPRYGADRT